MIYLYIDNDERIDYAQVGEVRTRRTDDDGPEDGAVATTDEPRVYRATYDFDGRRALSTTVIEEVGDVEGPSSRVLADVIDPDCLDGLFRPVRHRTDRNDGVVQFPLDDHRITVYATGVVELRRIDD